VCVNGRYSTVLSDITDISEQLRFTVYDKGEGTLSPTVLNALHEVPDSTEQPRDSFGSDYITALNMVSTKRYNLSRNSITDPLVDVLSSLMSGQARCSSVMCIEVPEGQQVSVPLQVLHCHVATTTQQKATNTPIVAEAAQSAAERVNDVTSVGTEAPATSFPALVVTLGRGAGLQLKQAHITATAKTHRGPGSPATASVQSFVAGTTRIVLAEDAALNHTQLLWNDGGAHHLSCWFPDVRLLMRQVSV
jgi:hypothetical protein